MVKLCCGGLVYFTGSDRGFRTHLSLFHNHLKPLTGALIIEQMYKQTPL